MKALIVLCSGHILIAAVHHDDHFTQGNLRVALDGCTRPSDNRNVGELSQNPSSDWAACRMIPGTLQKAVGALIGFGYEVVIRDLPTFTNNPYFVLHREAQEWMKGN